MEALGTCWPARTMPSGYQRSWLHSLGHGTAGAASSSGGGLAAQCNEAVSHALADVNSVSANVSDHKIQKCQRVFVGYAMNASFYEAMRIAVRVARSACITVPVYHLTAYAYTRSYR